MSTYTIHAKTVGGIKKESIHASEVKAKKAIVGVHSPNTIRLYYGSIQLLRPERRMNECGKVGGVEYRADMTTA